MALRARSSVGERSLHTREVAGSKPAAPIEKTAAFAAVFLLRARIEWRTAGYGPEANLEVTNIHKLRKGKILDIEYFWDHAEALEALGVSEQDAHADS